MQCAYKHEELQKDSLRGDEGKRGEGPGGGCWLLVVLVFRGDGQEVKEYSVR